MTALWFSTTSSYWVSASEPGNAKLLSSIPSTFRTRAAGVPSRAAGNRLKALCGTPRAQRTSSRARSEISHSEKALPNCRCPSSKLRDKS